MTIRTPRDKARRDRLLELWASVEKQGMAALRARLPFRVAPIADPRIQQPAVAYGRAASADMVSLVEFRVRSGTDWRTRCAVWVVEAVDGKGPPLVVSGPHGGRGP